MRTCPAPGVGISRSTIWKSAPFIGTIAAFIVAMIPPSTLALKNTSWLGDRTFVRPGCAFTRVRCAAWLSTSPASCRFLRPKLWRSFERGSDFHRTVVSFFLEPFCAYLTSMTPESVKAKEVDDEVVDALLSAGLTYSAHAFVSINAPDRAPAARAAHGPLALRGACQLGLAKKSDLLALNRRRDIATLHLWIA